MRNRDSFSVHEVCATRSFVAHPLRKLGNQKILGVVGVPWAVNTTQKSWCLESRHKIGVDDARVVLR